MICLSEETSSLRKPSGKVIQIAISMNNNIEQVTIKVGEGSTFAKYKFRNINEVIILLKLLLV